jgi:uncharacterized CHY-type Zn-finger protein
MASEDWDNEEIEPHGEERFLCSICDQYIYYSDITDNNECPNCGSPT